MALGFEPRTACLEGRCSIQLSYATINYISFFILSGWQDSNLRPPRPKRGAITGLRYTPKIKNAERQGLEPWRQLPVDRLAICSITTLAPLLNYVYELVFASANVALQMLLHNLFFTFFNYFFS